MKTVSVTLPLILCLFTTPRTALAFVARSPSCRVPRLASPSSLSNDKAPRHDVGNNPMDQLSPEMQATVVAYQEHQQNAEKLDWATDVRTLIQYNHGFAVMSTNSKSNPGYPGGSVVGFAVDDDGRPLFIFSSMSTHTQDLLADPRCSVTIASKDFKGAADGRVNLMGTCKLIKNAEEKEMAKEFYMKKHPGAFWVEFGDFNWFRVSYSLAFGLSSDNVMQLYLTKVMQMEVENVRFVGGFARAGSVTPEQYVAAKPDPISEFSGAIAGHMNEDHQEATIAMVEANIPGMKDAENPIEEALITSVDSLGMYVKVTRAEPMVFLPKSFKVRLPFPSPASDRKDVKMKIMELTQAAAAAQET